MKSPHIIFRRSDTTFVIHTCKSSNSTEHVNYMTAYNRVETYLLKNTKAKLHKNIATGNSWFYLNVMFPSKKSADMFEFAFLENVAPKLAI